jgi:hypothetical protein
MTISIGNFLVTEGTDSNDFNPSVTPGKAYLGKKGDDTIWAEKTAYLPIDGVNYYTPSMVSGGTGNDRYRISYGASTVIADASISDNESVIIYDYTANMVSFFSIDNRHIVLSTSLGTNVFVIDALNINGRIEAIEFQDLTISGSENSLRSFISNYKTADNQTWESLISQGFLNLSAMGVQNANGIRQIIDQLYSYNVTNTYATSLVKNTINGSAPTLAKHSFDYKFYNLGGGRYGIQEKGASKIDEITGVSSLKFADQTLTPANDVAATFNQVKGKDDVSGVVFRLYNAAFSRLPDATGLQNWINGNAAGNVTYASSAQNFSESQEFKNRYGSNVTDTQFITTLYNNVLGRTPEAGGLSHYQSLLAGGRSRGALLLDFSESPENRVLFTQVTGLE